MIVTRFAPSPTGMLHIGGARTALFNYLLARRHGGKFLLRIEDTDTKRNTPEAVAAIHQGMEWLGLDYDGEPVSQASRVDRHREVAQELLANGLAYKCYTSTDELAAMRQKAIDAKVPFKFESPWRDYTPDWSPSLIDELPSEYVIRLRSPKSGETVIDDVVQGRVTVSNAEIDDYVILRADGTPTYMLASVVDDFDMGVTHIVRGDDHLNNAFRQLILIRAMGWAEPIYAHIPLIHSETGKKYSKRDGAVGVMDFADKGILPDALFNALLRLGWGHGDDEIISRKQAAAWFDLDGVKKGAARFDMKKLLSLNSHYIRQMSDGELLDRITAHFGQTDIDRVKRHKLLILMPLVKDRAKTLDEAFLLCSFYFEKPSTSRNDFPEIVDILRKLDENEWFVPNIEGAFRDFATRRDLKLKDVVAPVRVMLTGQQHSLPMWQVIAALGREETIARLA